MPYLYYPLSSKLHRSSVVEKIAMNIQINQTIKKNKQKQKYSFELLGNIIRPAYKSPHAWFRISPLESGNMNEELLEILEVHSIRFEAQLNAEFQFNPNAPLPKNLGFARERVRCTFEYDGCRQSWDGLLPVDYPMKADLECKEDRYHNRDVYTIYLKTFGEGRQLKEVVPVVSILAFVPHILFSSNSQHLDKFYFDGESVYYGHIVFQEWRSKFGNYVSETLSGVLELPNHQGNKIIYVEPFSIKDLFSKPKENYIGAYDFIGILTQREGLQGRENDKLIYSDGSNVFVPLVSQECWGRDGDQIGFFIASYNPDKHGNMNPQILQACNLFDEGLYQRVECQKRGFEKWKRLGGDAIEVEIKVDSLNILQIKKLIKYKNLLVFKIISIYNNYYIKNIFNKFFKLNYGIVVFLKKNGSQISEESLWGKC